MQWITSQSTVLCASYVSYCNVLSISLFKIIIIIIPELQMLHWFPLNPYHLNVIRCIHLIPIRQHISNTNYFIVPRVKLAAFNAPRIASTGPIPMIEGSQPNNMIWSWNCYKTNDKITYRKATLKYIPYYYSKCESIKSQWIFHVEFIFNNCISTTKESLPTLQKEIIWDNGWSPM